MSLKILHTADWHLGQTFFEFDRTYEHRLFLEWLLRIITEKEIDVLLICGDVFDVSNPSAASMRLFYDFLRDATRINSHLQIVIIAGNHDSPSRLEMPKPLLEAFNIHVIGNIERFDSGAIDFEKIVFPLKDKSLQEKALCMAIPFIRLCDFMPGSYNGSNLAENICQIYKQVYEYTLLRKKPGQGIIALGHLHIINAQISENDKSERLLMGGQEFVPISVFHDNIAYVALGHIHKAQKFTSKEHIRYSGSPIPMSFSEINYKHQVTCFEIEEEKCTNIQSVEIPVTVPLMRIPNQHKMLEEVLIELSRLPQKDADELNAPYLEVRVLLSGPEPALRHKIESALADKQVRLARIDTKYNHVILEKEEALTVERFQELRPYTVFQKMYKKKFDNEIPDNLKILFNQVVQEIKSNSI